MAPSRSTRRFRKGAHVLNVRSDGAVKSFEKMLSRGPLTLVYINAKWCGACHRFNDEVWSPLTKLKNRSVNLASVDSESIGKTSLAKVPRKFYPTLMLVGKDGKPATFEDEEGQPTNAMPRNSTLSEDREALSNLVVNPTVKVNLPKRMNSPPRANVTVKSLARSPFEPRNNQTMNSVISQNKNMASKKMGNAASAYQTKPIMSSNPPDIGADLVASQTKSPTPTAAIVPESIKGGSNGLLNAIKSKTASLRSMLQMRNHSTRRNRK